MTNMQYNYVKLAIAIGLTWLGSVLAGSATQAQIGLRILLDPDELTYRVYLTSMGSYSGIKSVIATAQVTLNVPHGTGNDQFIVTNLTSGIAGMHWEQSERADAPAENRDRDYLFFSFINNASPFVRFPIVAGQTILLFTFQRKGNCLGRVELMNNVTDPFRAPNSLGINTGNSVSLLGTPGNAYLDDTDTTLTGQLKASSLSVCTGVPVSFSAVLSSTPLSVSTYIYQWFVDDQSLGPATALPTTSHTFAASFSPYEAVIRARITMAGTTPCQSPVITARQTILVKPTPPAQILYTGNTCTTLPTSLTIIPTVGATYQWLRDTVALPGRTDSSLWVERNGSYAVQVSLNICQATSIPVSIVGVSQGEEVTIRLTPLPLIVQGTRIMLDPQVTNAQSFTWSPADGLSSAFVRNPTVTSTSTTTYTLTAQSTQGCAVSDTVTVYVLAPLYIPTAFTPNGDGVNDTWEIRNVGAYLSCRVCVFDRWGGQVFFSADYATPWDGKINGIKAASGIYVYSVQTPLAVYQGELIVL